MSRNYNRNITVPVKYSITANNNYSILLWINRLNMFELKVNKKRKPITRCKIEKRPIVCQAVNQLTINMVITVALSQLQT